MRAPKPGVVKILLGMSVVAPIVWLERPSSSWQILLIGSLLGAAVVYLLELGWFWFQRRSQSPRIRRGRTDW